jgi:hypothetical protein
MRRGWGVRAAGIACLSLVVGCGGSGGGGAGFNVGGPSACGRVGPCGGDPVGTWNFDTGCITAAGVRASMSGNSCPGTSIAVTGVSVSGTATFNADLTYALDALMKQGTYRVYVPPACLGAATCDDISASVLATGAFQSVTCTSGGGCTCSAVQTPIIVNESGAYTISGSTLLTTADTGATSSIDYCVQGMYLHMLDTQSMNMGLMGQATVDEDTVATKQ